MFEVLVDVLVRMNDIIKLVLDVFVLEKDVLLWCFVVLNED